MLTRIFLIHYIVIVLLILPLTIQAKEISHISSFQNNLVIGKINSFFLEYPKKRNFIWVPIIEGKSKYVLSIPKAVFKVSQKHSDASDLYYLSEKIDKGLKFHRDKIKRIDIEIEENNIELVFNQSTLSNINLGFFLQKKEKTSTGLIINKDFVVLNELLVNLSARQSKDTYPIFDAKFVKLVSDEKSELHGNINHEFKSGIFNFGTGYTWFEVLNKFDLTIDFQQNNELLQSKIHTTFDYDKSKLQIGLKHLKNKPGIDMFLNLEFQNIKRKKYFDSRLTLNSGNDIINHRNLTLKNFRKKSLDSIWRKYMVFK